MYVFVRALGKCYQNREYVANTKKEKEKKN